MKLDALVLQKDFRESFVKTCVSVISPENGCIALLISDELGLEVCELKLETTLFLEIPVDLDSNEGILLDVM